LINEEPFAGLLLTVAYIVALAICLGKPLVEFLKTRRNVKSHSQMFADELTDKWRDVNMLDEMESNIEAEKEAEERKQNDIRRDYESSRKSIKWDKEAEENKYNIQDDFESRIDSAECALAGSDEELLNFYDMDNQTKNYYLEKIYEGAW